MKKILFISALLIRLLVGGDFEDGWKAFKEEKYKKALDFYQKASNQGDVSAQTLLGKFYEKGIIVKQNYKEAVKFYTKAAVQEFRPAECNLGRMYEEGKGVKQDYKEALKWYQKASKHGYPEAQYRLGGMYEEGKEVKQDYKEALKWYQKASNHGYSEAQFLIGLMYYKSQDYKQARELFQKAAKKGSTESQFTLGLMYIFSLGVKLNYQKAQDFFVTSCQNGLIKSCDKINFITSVFKTENNSFFFVNLPLMKECRNNSIDSCYQLGKLYSLNTTGEVKQSINKAKFLFDVTCKAGHKQGCRDLLNISSH